MTLVALIAPSGIPVEETIAGDRASCWANAFDFLSYNGVGNLLAINRDGIELEQAQGIKPAKSRYFYRRYYKRVKESREYARRWDYKIQVVKLVVK
jgi:hypothetical protein